MNLTRMRKPEFARVVSLTSLAFAFGAMAVLHVVQSNLDPVHEPVSFYVHGNCGWLLPVALGFFGVAALALATFAADLSPTGRRLLRVFGVGMLITAIIPSDRWFPWEATPTAGGIVHAAAAVIAPLLFLFVMFSVVRTGGPTRRIEMSFVAVYLVAMIGSASSLAAGFLLDVPPPYIGLAERILAVSAVGWIARVAIRAGRWTSPEEGRPSGASNVANATAPGESRMT